MTSTAPRAGLRLRPLFLIVALAIGLIGLAPASAAQADPPQARIRAAIAKAAITQINKRESGNNYYPIAYKINRDVKRPAAWCGVFANWAWWKGGATKRPNMRGSGVNQGHWATYWQKWGKANHRWKPISQRRVAPGDAVVYGNYPQSVHVGVVVGVRYDSRGRVSYVRTVEGNLSDKVKDMKWRKITQLRGGGRAATGFVSPV